VAEPFVGRIAWSADGNHNDRDDWAASPVALAIFAACGARDRLVHFDYNSILPRTHADWERIHGESVLGAARRFGYDLGRFHDCRQDLEAALSSIARAIDASTADDPLYFLLAGPMEVPLRGIERAQPDRRRFVYCISHSRWNDGYSRRYSFTHTKRAVIATGVNWVQIADQNRLLSTSPYGREAPPDGWRPYHWMRDAGDENVRFLWDRLVVSTRPDPSDAGMAYFLMTGDEQADPVKLERLLTGRVVPPRMAVRPRVRLEAECFRELDGFEVEDRDDRAASHALQVRLTGTAGRIRTRFDEPFTGAAGRYDVEVRFWDELQKPCRFRLLVNGRVQGDSWGSPGTGQGWTSQVLEDVVVRRGDELSVEAEGPPGRLDYIQLQDRGRAPTP
jgi:hypothetical protein